MREIATEEIETDDKQLSKELYKISINPCYFTHKVLKAAFNNKLASQQSNHIYSKLTIISKN